VHVTDRRIPSLDGVRGLAILVVVIHNASWILNSSEQVVLELISTATATGWVGVQLFFVLSGFLITGILIDTRDSPTYFRSFYLRRVLRIFPLYYVFLAGAFFVFPLVASTEWNELAGRYQIWYWSYLANWSSPLGLGIPGLSHLWSLAVEEQFYLLWPLIVSSLRRRTLIKLCVTVILVTPLVRLGINLVGLPPNAAYEFTVARWDALAGGGLLAILMVEDSWRALLASVSNRIGSAAVLALAVIFLTTRGFVEDNLLVQVVGQSAAVVLFGCVILVAVTPTGARQEAARKYLRARWLRFLGKYSYAVYVFHFPVHIIASKYLGAAVNGPDDPWRILRWAAYVTAVGVVSTLLAIVSWSVLEKPFLNLKDKLAPRGGPVPSAP
jgi:peptidoglycan/LPS O-acetylase OafA/YrhL